MTKKDIRSLRERAKELRCLYAVDSVVSDRGQTPAQAFRRVLQEIPAGWHNPETTGASIEYLGRCYVGPGFDQSAATMAEPIRLWQAEVGKIVVSDAAAATEGSFLPEEGELLRRIANRIGEHLEWKHSELLDERGTSHRDHWAWRQRFAEALADKLDAERLGVRRLFIGGSTARGDAGPASDIDLYVVFDGSEETRRELAQWIEGWSLCLAEVALFQTGQPFPDGILNVQWLDDEPGVWQRAELQELRVRT